MGGRDGAYLNFGPTSRCQGHSHSIVRRRDHIFKWKYDLPCCCLEYCFTYPPVIQSKSIKYGLQDHREAVLFLIGDARRGGRYLLFYLVTWAKNQSLW